MSSRTQSHFQRNVRCIDLNAPLADIHKKYEEIEFALTSCPEKLPQNENN